MNLPLKVLLILIVALYACNGTPRPAPELITSGQLQIDTTDQEIYDFMKEIIVLKNLKPTNGLDIDPDPNCFIQEPDNVYLNNFLIGTEIEGTYDMFDRCLTKEDISFMLSQKNMHPGFKWNNSRLGFTMENRNSWYTFSIPLFSRDSSKVIMMIRDMCPGLCGSGETLLFKKENNEWISSTSGVWYH